MLYSEFIGRRKNTFEKSYELILDNMIDNKVYNIVELGSSRSYVTGGVEGCLNPDKKYWSPNNPRLWDWGAGVFTKVFSDNLKAENFKLYTIDPDDAANIITTTMCGDDDNVIVVQGFSSDFLNTIDFKIDFLYMDHMESSEEASIQHLKDCELIINNNLMSDNGIILIDDVGDNMSCTKGKYSIPYLMKHNFTVLIHEYQVLMVRETREHLDP